MIARLITFLFAFGLFAGTAAAESASAIRQRMEQRLSQIDDLKAREIVGENNRGFLEIRRPDADGERTVSDENRDREAVYALIARETGASPDAVGRARAKQIAQQSRSGVWVQDESGRWYRK